MFRAPSDGSSTPPDPNDLVVIDWQATGGGHLSTEVFYMLIQASCRQPSIPSENPFLSLLLSSVAADSSV